MASVYWIAANAHGRDMGCAPRAGYVCTPQSAPPLSALMPHSGISAAPGRSESAPALRCLTLIRRRSFLAWRWVVRKEGFEPSNRVSETRTIADYVTSADRREARREPGLGPRRHGVFGAERGIRTLNARSLKPLRLPVSPPPRCAATRRRVLEPRHLVDRDKVGGTRRPRPRAASRIATGAARTASRRPRHRQIVR